MSGESTEKTPLESASESIARVQDFDVDSIIRSDELGAELNFRKAVEPSQRLVDLYRQLPLQALEWVPADSLNALKTQADSDFNLLRAPLEFSTNTQNPRRERDTIIEHIDAAYGTAFNQLRHFIAYGVTRVTDFDALGTKARAVLQGVEDRATDLGTTMQSYAEEAQRILEDVRAVAAEQGVSQEAIYFKNEADAHAVAAAKWLGTTVVMTILLAILACGALVVHKWAWLSPTTTYEAVQLAIGKVLLLGAVGSFALIASRNYAANRHNAIVNKHRQNALLTYRSLVDAAGDEANRDIILQYAAHAIYFDQPTGFTKTDTSDGRSAPLVSLSNRGMFPGDGGPGT